MNRSQMTSVVKTLFLKSGVIAFMRRVARQPEALAVLRYHSVSEGADYCPPSIAVSPDLFDQHIRYLTQHYKIIDLDAVMDCLETGRPLPRRSAVITFDDGYMDNFTHALPILKKYGATATFFIAAGPLLGEQAFWVGALQQAVMTAKDPKPLAEEFGVLKDLPAIETPEQRQSLINEISIQINLGDLPNKTACLQRAERALDRAFMSEPPESFMMREEQARGLVAEGMTVGSHTVTHPIMSSLPDDQAVDELNRSRSMLESVIDRPVRHFAYPNGPEAEGFKNFNAQASKLTQECGYRAAWTSERGPVVRESDPFAMPRQGINQKLNLGAFAFKLEEHRFGPLLLGA